MNTKDIQERQPNETANQIGKTTQTATPSIVFAGIKAITQQLKNRNYENVVKRSETFARQNRRGSQADIAAINISNKQTKPQ